MAAGPVSPEEPEEATDPDKDGPTDGDVALDYSRAPGAEADCMTEGELRAAAGLTRTDLFAPPGEPARYRVRIAIERAQGERSYRAVVTLRDAAGEQLGQSIADGNRCTDVITNVIVGLYHAIGPRPAPKPPAAPRLRPLTDKELLSAVCSRLRDVYGPCMDVRAAVLAGGLFSAGFPTDVAGGFYVGGDVFFGEYLKERWSVGLEVKALMPAVAAHFADGQPFKVSSVTGALVPCFHYSVLAACGTLEGGTVIYGGAGKGGNDFDLFASTGPRLGVVVPIRGRFAFRAFADLRFMLSRSPQVLRYNLVPGETWLAPVANGLFGVGFSY